MSAAQWRGVDPEALRAVRIWVAEREEEEERSGRRERR